MIIIDCFIDKVWKKDFLTKTEMKKLIKEMSKSNPNVDYNIYKALDNVNLNCVIGTKKNGEYESFLNRYE